MNQSILIGDRPANDDATSDPRRFKRLAIPKLTAERRFAFEELAPTALWIAANLAGPQQRYWGDNLGGWPVLMGLTQYWEDRRSAGLASTEPYQERALILRFWFDDWDEADRVWQATYKNLRASFDDAKGDWMSFTCDTAAPVLLERQIRAEAAAIKAEVWTDTEMLRRFDWMIAAARKMAD